tara:strand:- start:6652 stop:7155 length:504 start_codon:yes stop_codon:yes gene_type:complete
MANNIYKPTMVKAVWDIGVSGTLATNKSYAPSTSTNSDSGYVADKSIIIPEGSLILRAYTYCETALSDDDDNSTTLALGYTGATGAFIAATACNTAQYGAGIGMTLVDNYALDGNALTNTAMGAARDATLLYTAADVELLLTLNNDHNIDAGKITLFVEYVQTGDIA